MKRPLQGRPYRSSGKVSWTTSLNSGVDDSDCVDMRDGQQVLEFFRWAKFVSQGVPALRAGQEHRLQARQGVGDFGRKDVDDRRRRSSDGCEVEDVASRESRRAETDFLDDHLLEGLESDVAVSVPLPGESGVRLQVRRQKIDFAPRALELEVMAWPLEPVADRSRPGIKGRRESLERFRRHKNIDIVAQPVRNPQRNRRSAAQRPIGPPISLERRGRKDVVKRGESFLEKLVPCRRVWASLKRQAAQDRLCWDETVAGSGMRS